MPDKALIVSFNCGKFFGSYIFLLMSEILHKVKEKAYKYNNSSGMISHNKVFVNYNCTQRRKV